jgi:hypothetical protein
VPTTTYTNHTAKNKAKSIPRRKNQEDKTGRRRARARANLDWIRGSPAAAADGVDEEDRNEEMGAASGARSQASPRTRRGWFLQPRRWNPSRALWAAASGGSNGRASGSSLPQIRQTAADLASGLGAVTLAGAVFSPPAPGSCQFLGSLPTDTAEHLNFRFPNDCFFSLVIHQHAEA